MQRQIEQATGDTLEQAHETGEYRGLLKCASSIGCEVLDSIHSCIGRAISILMIRQHVGLASASTCHGAHLVKVKESTCPTCIYLQKSMYLCLPTLYLLLPVYHSPTHLCSICDVLLLGYTFGKPMHLLLPAAAYIPLTHPPTHPQVALRSPSAATLCARLMWKSRQRSLDASWSR
jgi:hypothetical protein